MLNNQYNHNKNKRDECSHIGNIPRRDVNTRKNRAINLYGCSCIPDYDKQGCGDVRLHEQNRQSI